MLRDDNRIVALSNDSRLDLDRYIALIREAASIDGSGVVLLKSRNSMEMLLD
jgi:hypothetical protein